jgi:radical SAM protein with 4Fe4S-binding SPASM domain
MNVLIGINRLVPIKKSLMSEVLNPQELKSALEKISKLKNINPLIKCSDVLLFLVDNERLNLFKDDKKKGIIGGCIAGIASLYICSNGDVLSCPFINYPISNVFKESIENIWFNNSILTKLRNRKSFNGNCGSCEFTNCCGGCRASSFYQTGSLFNSDPNCFYKN